LNAVTNAQRDSVILKEKINLHVAALRYEQKPYVIMAAIEVS
jgi:hypothetical protein